MSTTESMICPISGSKSTHLMTGYVHNPYKDTYTMLAKHCGYTSFLLVKGTEGGVVPSFRAPAKVVRHSSTSEPTVGATLTTEHEFELEALGLLRDYRAEDIPDTTKASNAVGMKWDIDALAAECADKGVSALHGTQSGVQDAAIMAASLVLWHLGKATNMTEAVAVSRKVIDSGEALARLKAGIG